METVTKFSNNRGRDANDMVWLTDTRTDTPIRCPLCEALNWAKNRAGDWLIEQDGLIYHIVTTG